jgi:hypothetical protein
MSLSGRFGRRAEHNRSRWRFRPVFMAGTQPDRNSLDTFLMISGSD